MKRRNSKAALVAALCLLASAALLAACAGGAQTLSHSKGQSGQASWTVLVYLCGTNLESEDAAGTYNLKEIAEAAPNAGINVIIETGGCKEWHAKDELGIDIPTDRLARWRYNSEGTKFEKVDEQPLAGMASADTLSDFIRWGAKNYPARKYALVIWDHGGGSNGGLIWDDLHDPYSLSLEEFSRGLALSGIHLEAVALDACLMATLETAQALSPYANYLIASEEVVPGYGSAYTSWVKYLSEHPESNGADLGRNFCTASLQKYSDIGQPFAFSTTTFSCIDLSKIGAVSKAFGTMFAELSAVLDKPSDYATFAYHVDGAQKYYYPTMVDLEDFAIKGTGVGIKKETADAVKKAVDAAVLANSSGKARSGSHGLAFFYNLSATPSEYDHYSRNSPNASYLAFLDRICNAWTAPTWVYSQVKRRPDIGDAGYRVFYKLDLPEGKNQLRLSVVSGNEMISEIDCVLYYYDKEHDNWLCLGLDPRIESDVRNATYYSGIDGSWLGVNGSLCYENISDEKPGYYIFSIPFKDTRDDSFNLLRGAYIFDTPLSGEAVNSQVISANLAGHFEVYGVWDGDEAYEGAPSRNVRTLEDYYTLKLPLIFPSAQLRGNQAKIDEEGMDSLGEVTFTRNTQLSKVRLPAGKYKIGFIVADMLKRVNKSELMDMEIKDDGSYTISEPKPDDQAQGK